jgi:hypothetical protein
MGRSRFGSVIFVVYVVIGVFVANSRKYFVHLASFHAVVSAVLSVILWPLLLGGVSLHIR